MSTQPKNKITYKFDDQSTYGFNVLIFFIPLLYLGMLVYLKIEHPSFYQDHFMRESSPVEYLTFIAYLLAALYAGLIVRKLYRMQDYTLTTLYSLLSIALFVIAMEEINWGQRLLGIETPAALRELNLQREFNLHNILATTELHMLFIIMGFYGAFARQLIPERYKQRYPLQVKFLTPPFSQSLYFLPAFLLYMYYTFLQWPLVRLFGQGMRFSRGFIDEASQGEKFQYFMHSKDQEPIELLLGVGMAIFVISIYYQFRASSN